MSDGKIKKLGTRTVIVSDKRRCYFVRLNDQGKWCLGIVTENEPGYNEVKPDSDVGGVFEDDRGPDGKPKLGTGEIHAHEVADELNKKLGLDKRDAANIITSSIRVSDVRVVNEDGSTVRRRQNRFGRTK